MRPLGNSNMEKNTQNALKEDDISLQSGGGASLESYRGADDAGRPYDSGDDYDENEDDNFSVEHSVSSIISNKTQGSLTNIGIVYEIPVLRELESQQQQQQSVNTMEGNPTTFDLSEEGSNKAYEYDASIESLEKEKDIVVDVGKGDQKDSEDKDNDNNKGENKNNENKESKDVAGVAPGRRKTDFFSIDPNMSPLSSPEGSPTGSPMNRRGTGMGRTRSSFMGTTMPGASFSVATKKTTFTTPKTGDGRQLRDTTRLLARQLPAFKMMVNAVAAQDGEGGTIGAGGISAPASPTGTLTGGAVGSVSNTVSNTSAGDTKGQIVEDINTDEGYFGQINPEGLSHGNGIMIWSDDSAYEGHWEEGMRHGYGVMKWMPSGDVYEGHWYKDRQKGEGRMIYATDYGPDGAYKAGQEYDRDPEDEHHQHDEGKRYVGERDKEGHRHGQGKFVYDNKDYYDGHWEGDTMTGYGMLLYTLGDLEEYEGHFEANHLSGVGSMKYRKNQEEPESGHYTGDWNHSMRQGEGEMWYGNGDYYRGSWYKDKRHGHGYFKYSNGDHYEGEWTNDMKEGEGCLGFVDGRIHQGPWSKDEFVGVIFAPDHDYVGDYNMTRDSYMYGLKQGHGRKEWKDGSNRVYDGQWHCDEMIGYVKLMLHFFGKNSLYIGTVVDNGVPHGNGKMQYPTGDVYKGQFDHGLKHGRGEMKYADGTVRVGRWYRDRGLFRKG